MLACRGGPRARAHRRPSVEITEQDARRGRHSKVASIELFEASGERQFPTCCATIDRLLEPGRLACVQTILLPDQRWDRSRRTPEGIERPVFSGCLIPSLSTPGQAATRRSSPAIHRVEEIGGHSGETLRRRREAFKGQIEKVRALGYDRRFELTWDLYLAVCEAAFRTCGLRDAQLALSR